MCRARAKERKNVYFYYIFLPVPRGRALHKKQKNVFIISARFAFEASMGIKRTIVNDGSDVKRSMLGLETNAEDSIARLR